MKRLLFSVVMVCVGCESGASRAASKAPGTAGTTATTKLPVDADQSASLSDAEVKHQVSTYLRSIDTAIPAESWQSLGPRGAAQLLAVVGDAKAMPTTRSHAIDGLAMMGWKAAVPAVTAVAFAETEHVSVRFSAVRALGGLSSDEAALTSLLTSAGDARVRAAAGEVLAKREHGCDAVARQAASEKDEAREMFTRALKHCAK